jgi:hypothetical protein
MQMVWTGPRDSHAVRVSIHKCGSWVTRRSRSRHDESVLAVDDARLVTTWSGPLRQGSSPGRIRAQLASRRWQRIGLAIVLHNGPLSPHQRWVVARVHGGPRAVLTAFTAAEAYGLRGWERKAVDLLVPNGTRLRRGCPPPGSTAHPSRRSRTSRRVRRHSARSTSCGCAAGSRCPRRANRRSTLTGTGTGATSTRPGGAAMVDSSPWRSTALSTSRCRAGGRTSFGRTSCRLATWSCCPIRAWSYVKSRHSLLRSCAGRCCFDLMHADLGTATAGPACSSCRVPSGPWSS